ncbi:hypothetical protein WA1_04480 [Scytonema hofmannii PCC 7110]|uniref:HTH OST-type domain-containing protein n=1 Tax=Scytonema hofmannii PCC 7110 TaxID=128403 RepID=A0A139WZ84_9CYAN|nr:hypothetical protein [Scytonema hofmannii]KYC37777.1 hypothetical protein WA1_04480 [Scytonema hofmannii PCC 7110]
MSNNFLVQNKSSSSINSIDELEQALRVILKSLINQSQEGYVIQGILGGELHKRYGEGINKMLKRLQFDGNFTQFLEFSKSVKLDKTEKNYRITLI